MRARDKPWQIAADLEAAAKAVLEASLLLDAIHPSALAEVEDIPGVEHIEPATHDALIALSAKWQAIADAEETI